MTELITRDELHDLITRGQVIVVDALPASDYDRQHLPGAINLIEADVLARAAELLPDKAAHIVTCCSNAACGNSQAVADRLRARGYSSVSKYGDGIQDWVEAGLFTDATVPA